MDNEIKGSLVIDVSQLKAAMAQAQAAVKAATQNMSDAQAQLGSAAEGGNEQAVAALKSHEAELANATASYDALKRQQSAAAEGLQSSMGSYREARVALQGLSGSAYGAESSLALMLSRVAGGQAIIGTLFSVAAPIAFGEIIFSVGKEVHDLYENFISLDGIEQKFYDDVKKLQQQDFINVHSLETANLRLREATENASNLRAVADSFKSDEWTKLLTGDVRGFVADIAVAHSALQNSTESQKQSMGLDEKKQNLQHELNLQQIETDHAKDGELEGEQRINAELQKKLALNKENAQFERQRDRLMGNVTPSDAGGGMQALKDAQARGEAEVARIELARQTAEQALRQAQEAFRQIVGGDKEGKIDAEILKNAKETEEHLDKVARAYNEMNEAAQKSGEVAQKAFREAQDAAAQFAHEQSLQGLQQQMESIQLNPKNRNADGQLDRNALEQIRQIHQEILQEDERFVQTQEAIYAGDNEKVRELMKQGGQIQLQAGQQWAKDTEQITKQIQMKWQAMWKDINQDLTQTVNSVLRGTMTIGQAFMKMFQEMELQVIDAAMMKLLQSVEKLMNIGGSQTNTSQQQLQQARQNNPPLVESYSAAAAAEVFAETSGDVAAAAATYAEGMIYFPLASFDKGTSYVPRDGMAMLHQGEAVLPPPQTSELRSALSGRGRAGSTGNTSIDYRPSFHGYDKDSMKGMLDDHADHILSIVQNGVNSGKIGR